jgi:hypothetical protein
MCEAPWTCNFCEKALFRPGGQWLAIFKTEPAFLHGVALSNVV